MKKGMVVGKRSMLTDNLSGEDIIYILKYSRFFYGAERDEYEVEYRFNVDTGELETPKPPRNIKYSKTAVLFTDVIDMEEIEKEMNVVGDNPESYFKACLEIYNRPKRENLRREKEENLKIRNQKLVVEEDN